jgi:hypothetical protein
MLDSRRHLSVLALTTAVVFASCTVDSNGTGAGIGSDASAGAGGLAGSGGSSGSGAVAGSSGVDASDASGPCGDLGERCCVGATCSAGACSPLGVCAIFGGAYQNQCGSSGTCSTKNQLTNGCICPGGFASAEALNAACSATKASNIEVCYPPPGADASPSSPGEWAGAYEQATTQDCGVTNDCLQGNPYNGNDCSCPPQATTLLSLSVNAVLCDSTIVPATIVLCIDGSAPFATFGGAYEQDMSGFCFQHNTLSQGCSCRVGTSPEEFSTFRPPLGDAGAPVPTKLVLCVR